MIRTRWAAIGAAVAVTLGAGGVGLVSATSPSDAVTFVPIEPCRLFDTRPDFQVGDRSTPLGADETFTVEATGDNGECTGIPDSATGLGLNVTAVDPSAATVLTIWGEGSQPNASSLNPTPGSPPTPNAVTSGLTGAGELNIWNAFGTVHVLADVVGYYTDHNHDDQYLPLSENSEAGIDEVQGASQDLSATPATIATVTVDTPSTGYLIVNSSAAFFGDDGITAQARCSITTGSVIDNDAVQIMSVDPTEWITLGGTRGLAVNTLLGNTVETTVNLVCDAPAGSPTIGDAQLTATFIPDSDASALVLVPAS